MRGNLIDGTLLSSTARDCCTDVWHDDLPVLAIDMKLYAIKLA
jgi:hypothetical protein